RAGRVRPGGRSPAAVARSAEGPGVRPANGGQPGPELVAAAIARPAPDGAGSARRRERRAGRDRSFRAPVGRAEPAGVASPPARPRFPPRPAAAWTTWPMAASFSTTG